MKSRRLPVLGNHTLDHQHEYLIHIFDVYGELLSYESDHTKRVVLLDKMVADILDFAYIHFSYEELCMKKKHYPIDDMLTHIADHEDFVRMIQICRRKIDSMSVCDFSKIVESWLAEHILRYDNHYVVWMENNPSNSVLADILKNDDPETILAKVV